MSRSEVWRPHDRAVFVGPRDGGWPRLTLDLEAVVSFLARFSHRLTVRFRARTRPAGRAARRDRKAAPIFEPLGAVAAGSVAAGSAMEAMEPRRMLSASVLNGVAIDGSYDPNKAIPILRDLGVKSIRMWHSTDFTKTDNLFWNDELQKIRQYADAGLDITLLVTPREGARGVPSYDQVKDHFKAILADYPQLKGQVDSWEIVNEPNVPKYFGGGYNGTANLAKYVSNVLRPAYEVLHAAGETVIGGGLTSSNHAAGVAELKRAGYDRYVDIGNVHPYWGNVQGFEDRIDEMREAFPGLPLTSTEWNTTSGYNDNDWANKLDDYYDVIKEKLVSQYYFRLGYDTKSSIHKAGLVYTNGRSYAPHNPYFNVYKGWANNQTSQPTRPAGPDLTPASTRPPTPSRPAPAPAPAPAPRPQPQPAPRPTPAPAPSRPSSSTTSAFSTLQAEDADVLRGLRTKKGSPTRVNYFSEGDYLKFDDVDFGTGARQVELRATSPGATGRFEIRLDGPNGRLVGTVNPAKTGGWHNWKSFYANLTGATGVHDLYVVGASSKNGPLPDVDWIKFKK